MFGVGRKKAEGSFSIHTRAAAIERMRREVFDLLVIGGGITGTAIARDAAMRGLSVALLEKGDFAAGTSSRSSKMVHGGLRYLKGGHVRLVREALHERGVLLRLAPHLVQPVSFLFPVYETGDDSRLKLRLGLTAYDMLAGSERLTRHTSLSREKAAEVEPLLRFDGLQGAFRFTDCLVNDARLTLATARSAVRSGAVTVNYAPVIALERDSERVSGASFRDAISGKEHLVRARVVVNAAGPWVDGLRALAGEPPMLRPTKGVHIVVPRARLPVSGTVVIPSDDRRMLFVVPAGECTYVGTTDTDYRIDPALARTDSEDAGYLLRAVNALFPETRLSPEDIVATWAGVRPLVAEEGAPTPSDVSRDYDIDIGPPGFYSIAGGKLTTCRSMAQGLVDRVIEEEGRRFGWQTKPPRTSVVPLVGGNIDSFERYRRGLMPALEESWGLQPRTAYRLLRSYGTEYVRVLAYALRDPALLRPLSPSCPVLRAEALYAAEEEMALTLEDFMARRTDLMLFHPTHGLDAAPEAARLMGSVLGWGWRERRRQVARYRESVAQMTALLNDMSPSQPKTAR
ncbi:MAG: glycerol-3-phosphate dehydrogenase [Dehalococcoidia bacterium]|nr:glycerol-3-phosphate dehydrogenase [Dehalococcoidia bacterium]